MECHAEKNPDARTCRRLAALYVILDHITEQDAEPAPFAYSASGKVDIDSDSDFAHVVKGRDLVKVWPVIDELMTVLQATNPRLYAGVIRQIQE